MTFHDQWAAAGRDATPGSYSWYLAFSRPYEPAPPPPVAPSTAIGRTIADMLAKLREDRKGAPMRQASPPRKQRTRRAGEMTISECAKLVGLGPRQFRKAALAVGLLQTEIVVREKENGSPEYLHTMRLAPDAVERGLGRRLEPRTGTPYDVLTPKGQEWAVARFGKVAEEKARNVRHVARDAVRRFLDQGKTQAEIARLTGLSRQLVSHHARKLAA